MNRILLLEDIQGWQERITEYLDVLGYEVIPVSTLAEAWANILDQAESFQLLLLDINLTNSEDQQGLTLLDMLRAQNITIPTVVLSAYLTIDILKTLINDYDQQVIAALEKNDFVQNPAKVRWAIERGISFSQTDENKSIYSPPSSSADIKQRPDASEQDFRQKLYEQIKESFNEEELKTLTWFLVVEYDDLLGNGRAAKTRELIGFMQRHGRLDEFVNALRRLRPHIDWSDSK